MAVGPDDLLGFLFDFLPFKVQIGCLIAFVAIVGAIALVVYLGN